MLMDIWIIYKGNTSVIHYGNTGAAASHMLGKLMSNYIIIKQERGGKPKVVVPLSNDVSELEKLIQAT